MIRGLGNAHAERLKIEGGVGRTEVDFTGEIKDRPIEAEINVGVGQIRILLPRQADVSIETESNFLSKISAPGFDKNQRIYKHNGLDAQSRRIVIRVRSGVGGVSVELI